ncbi:MAG: glycosyltransferase family 9 protein, partial [Bacteroidota bacterium]
MELKKILIIRFSSMGDIVLTSPVYRNLKRQFPHLKIHVLVKKQFSFIHLNNPNIDKVWETNNSGEDLLNQLVSEQFGFVADLQNNRRSNRLVRQLNRPTEKLNKLNIRKWFQVVFNLKGKNIPHVVFRYLEV